MNNKSLKCNNRLISNIYSTNFRSHNKLSKKSTYNSMKMMTANNKIYNNLANNTRRVLSIQSNLKAKRA